MLIVSEKINNLFAKGNNSVTQDLSKYDSRRLSYANTFNSPIKRVIIKAIEMVTAKPTLLRKVRAFEKAGIPFGQPFWSAALSVMGSRLDTPESEINRIPKHGPLVIVANHPHGLVDGMVLAALVGRVRTDYKILTRSLLTGVEQIDQFMIPVPFDHEENAVEKGLDMRRSAMAHLMAGGVIIVFPSGKVANSETAFGPVIEAPWNPFTANLITRSKAEVLPVFFPGRNSRAYQVAAQISATLRQSLLLFEIKHALGHPQRPHIGPPISQDELQKLAKSPRDLVACLREITLDLGAQT